VFDIVGTAFHEQKRPPLLKQSHVDSFYFKAKEDTSGVTPTSPLIIGFEDSSRVEQITNPTNKQAT
jgi:hypothetical protein